MRNWWQRFISKASLAGLIVLSSHAFFSLQLAHGQKASVKFSQVRIYTTSQDDILSIVEAGLAFDHMDYHPGYFDVILNSYEVNRLGKASLSYDILVDDLEAKYRSEPQLNKAEGENLLADMRQIYNVPQGFEFGSMGGYYTFDEVMSELDEMVSLFPNIITARQSIGTTIEGRDIWMVKISDNPNVNEDEEEVLYTSLMHAREPQGMANNMYFMWYVLENYGSDAVVDFLVDNRELYFVPVINADGYVWNEFTNPNGGGLWRKNRRDNGGGIFGVDLNRNYDFQWGFNNSGSSPTPSSELYRGTAPASEPETQTMQNFAISREFTMVFNYHAFGQVMNYPWGYLGTPNPDVTLFDSLSGEASLFNNFSFGTPLASGSGVPNGYSNDWYYGEQVLKGRSNSWTVEAGTSFWPNQNSIIPFALENFYSNLVLANGLGGGMPKVVGITAVPVGGAPVIVPAAGLFFDFDVTLTNNTNIDWTVDYWNTVTLPIGEEIGPQIGPFTAPVPANGAFTTTLTMEVPPRPPPATYGFNMKVGIFANGGVLDTDSFNIIKTPGPVPAMTVAFFSSDDWELNPAAEEILPEEFALEQNYPNPFNPSTTIAYQLPTAENVSLIIYDVSGRQVRELLNENREAGSYTVQWDGRNQAGQTVATGLYIYQIRAGQFNQTHKMLFMK